MENSPGPSTPASEPAVNVQKPLNNSPITQVFRVYCLCINIKYMPFFKI